MRRPKALSPGDLIAVVTPASPITEEKIANGVKLFEQRGYRLNFGEHCFDKDGYLAGSDQERAHDLESAWFDHEVKAVLCSRGGYGCARLLPFLDTARMAENPKLLIGFSDITSLHLALFRKGLSTLHGPMLLTLGVEVPEIVVNSLFDTMEGATVRVDGGDHCETVCQGRASGTVVGGCMCLVCDSIGTDHEVDTADNIFVIEDVDEAPHRVDAMLTHMINAGIMQQAAGIIIGSMTRTDEKAEPAIGARPWKQIVKERLAPLGIPTVLGFPFGHVADQHSLPLGVRAELNADAKTLVYEEPGVIT